MPKHNKVHGFTLIELLVVIGIIAVLAGIVIIALNPARQFALARNSTRLAHLNDILGAIGERTVQNRGVFETGCAAGPIPSTPTRMASTGGYNIGPCLVPTYRWLCRLIQVWQARIGGDTTDYDTGYDISQGADGRITVSAPGTELDEPLSITR